MAKNNKNTNKLDKTFQGLLTKNISTTKYISENEEITLVDVITCVAILVVSFGILVNFVLSNS